MSEPWVLKFPRTDDEGYLLLQVSSQGDSALDLNLLATEGGAPYRGKIRQRRVTDLRAKNYHGSDDDWQSILCHVFNSQSAASPLNDQGNSLQVIAAVAKGKAIITLRNRVDKITQRLGSVELSQDDDAEIQLFDWCGSAIDQTASLDAERRVMLRKYNAAQGTIAALESKLEELVKAKADHEEELVSKFVLLLNEKKLKIRNQQRILSTAKVDQKKLKQMQTPDGKGRRAGSSRAGKRRADAEPEEAEEENDSSDAFEQMQVDQAEGILAESQEASPERQTTPETETATESDHDPAEPPSRSNLPPEASEPHSPEASKKPPGPPIKTSRTRETRTTNDSPPPPARQLPFAKKDTVSKKASEREREREPKPEKSQSKARMQAPTNADDSGEETATDDDEL